MSRAGPGGSEAAFSGPLSSDVALVCQVVLPEDLRPLVPLEALQGEEVERPEAEGGLVLLRPGPGERTWTSAGPAPARCSGPDADCRSAPSSSSLARCSSPSCSSCCPPRLSTTWSSLW